MTVLRPRVYVAGPITQGNLQENIDRAREATRRLIESGFSPLCPHLTCFLAGNEPSVTAGVLPEVWLEIDVQWVKVSHALLRLPGPSLGADHEEAVALTRRIPVYCDLALLIRDREQLGPRSYSRGR
jgi:hypothetical protein